MRPLPVDPIVLQIPETHFPENLPDPNFLKIAGRMKALRKEMIKDGFTLESMDRKLDEIFDRYHYRLLALDSLYQAWIPMSEDCHRIRELWGCIYNMGRPRFDHSIELSAQLRELNFLFDLKAHIKPFPSILDPAYYQ